MSFFELSPNCLLMISFTYNLTSQDKKKKKKSRMVPLQRTEEKKNQGWFILKKKIMRFTWFKKVSDK